MARHLPIAALYAVSLFCAGAALAGPLDISITDQHGKPVANAVVTLTPNDAGAPAPATLPDAAVIDQNFETFLPVVTILKTGGTISFRNSDRTMHQVYSFSPLRQFELEVRVGATTAPLSFDKPGVVAIGCNIHDSMIAYVVVTDNPFTALSGTNGTARFAGLKPGQYRASVWQPDLAPGAPSPEADIVVSEAVAQHKFALRLTQARTTHTSHGSGY